MGINSGYICISTNEQNLDRQLEAIKPYVTDEKYLYSDKVSGKDMEHEGFRNILKAMRDGDTLYIKSINRLERNMRLNGYGLKIPMVTLIFYY